jgi:nucleotide-binding universal stress UspA family protein
MSMSRRVVRRILVAVEPDTSASCLDSADQIARAFDASLTAVQVLPPDAAAADVLGAADALAEQVGDDTGRSPGGFGATVRCGDAVGAILKQAADCDVDLLVVGTHERHGVDRWRSVSTMVTRLATCSVLVARSSSATRGPVLVACDLGPSTQRVLAMAGAFAQGLNEPLVALHAVEPNRHDLALIASAILSGTVTPAPDGSAVDAYRSVAEGALHGELAAAGVNGRPELGVGDAAPTVVDRARELHASLIVVGTHDGGFGRFVLGSVAEKIVRNAPCSVLIVRTPDPNAVSERSVERRDALAAVATEAVEGAVGAAAGAAAGIVAGPIGMIAGAALGAIAALALGRKTELAEHEAALHVRDLDAIEAEREFFGRADEEPTTNRYS